MEKYKNSSHTNLNQKAIILTNSKNDLFECIYQRIFENYLSNKINVSFNLTEFKIIYNDINSFYNSNISSGINDLISKNNYSSFELNENYLWDNKTNLIDKKSINFQYHLIPIPIGIDYDENFNITFNKQDFIYLLYIAETTDKESISNFFYVLLNEFILFFGLIIIVNLMIWISFDILFNCIFKSILKPLKEINKSFNDIYNIPLNNETQNEIIHKNNKIDIVNGIKITIESKKN